jgi:preprotein translocase subunit SecE
MNKLIEYIKSAIAEMKKVTWPTKKEAKNYTLIVIGFSIGVALFLGLLDYIFSIGISKIISRV